uniref:Golgin subfamily B member 1-like n=1 Tax=Callorhinchus milii TaxID=7868 RepID=A0A4W3JTZ8_CALMI
MQADLEQVTKRAASQASESGSADELQSRLLEWQEMVSEATLTRGQAKEEKAVMELRMAQIEEEREELIEDDWFFPGCSDPALVSGQQELEEELVQLRRLGKQQGQRKRGIDNSNLQDEYEYDEKRHFDDSSICMESPDISGGENMGGLRTVVEELELERNSLQEQILVLEERCQELEDKAQLRARIETLQVTFGVYEEGQLLRLTQNEMDRFQSQISLLRTQQQRDSEKHQQIVSSLNDQLKEIRDKKDILETTLVDKEKILVEASAKLQEIDKLKDFLNEQELDNKDHCAKLLQTEENLVEVTKKCKVFEVECTDLKTTVLDLTEKLSSNKEKVQKHECAMEVLREDLEQTNDELERLNSSHLEERARLIEDLQNCEREMDTLKEGIVEKENELAIISGSLADHSEQIEQLKKQIKSKEQQARDLEASLIKAEREVLLLKETRGEDEQDVNIRISSLVDQLSNIESELKTAQDGSEAKGKEIEIQMKQIRENNDTIQSLRSEIQKQNTYYLAQLAECQSQISSLKDHIAVTGQKLQETSVANEQEIGLLKAQLSESSSAKDELNRLLKEKEQSFESGMKTLKDQYNIIAAQADGKDDELVKLSKQLAEHTEHKEYAEKTLQNKTEMVSNLEQRLQTVEQTNSQLTQEVQIREVESKELKTQVGELSRSVLDLENQVKTLNGTNTQLQLTLDKNALDFSEQIKLVSELNEKSANLMQIRSSLESQVKDLTIENKTLKELQSNKDDELSNKTVLMQELEHKIESKEVEISQCMKTISQLQAEKDNLTPKAEYLKIMEQKEMTLVEQLDGKLNECTVLKNQLLEHQKTTEHTQGQVTSLTTQLEQLQHLITENKDALSNKDAECISLQNQLRLGQESLMQLGNQMNIGLVEKDAALKEKLSDCNGLQNQLSEQHVATKNLQDEVQTLEEERNKLRQWLADKESAANVQFTERLSLQEQLDQKTDSIALLQQQVETLTIQAEKVQRENKEFQISVSKRNVEYDRLQGKVNERQTAAALLEDQLQVLNAENGKLKDELKETISVLESRSNEVVSLQSLLSQQDEMTASLKNEISTLNCTAKKLACELQEKEGTLNQQVLSLQQFQAKTSQDETHLTQYMQIIAQLQNQVQALVSEATQLKLTLQEKETLVQQQTKDISNLQKTAAEFTVLKSQFVENMETISKLQNQIQDMTVHSQEFKQNMEAKDVMLACKVGDYVKLKAELSEAQDTVSHLRLQLASGSSEADQLKVILQEKELALTQIKESSTVWNEELALKMQTKEGECENFRGKIISLEDTISRLNNQTKEQHLEINQLKEVLLGKESSLSQQGKTLRKLQDKVGEIDLLKSQFTESTELTSQLQSQVQNLLFDSKKCEQMLQEKEIAFTHLQDRYATQSEQLNELGGILSSKEEELAGLRRQLHEKDETVQVTESNVNALNSEVEVLRQELEKGRLSLKDYVNLLQQRDEMLVANEKNTDTQRASLEMQKEQYKKVEKQLETLNQNMQQKDLTLQTLQEKSLGQAQHIEQLEMDLRVLSEKSSQESQDKIGSIQNLQQQCDQLFQEKARLEQCVTSLNLEKQEMDASYQSQLQQKLEELQVLEENIATHMCRAREQIDVMQHMKGENEHLQTQVSLKSEEIAGLKLEIQEVKQILKKSEQKLAECAREAEQISPLTEKLGDLEKKLELKDVNIGTLQQAFDTLQEQLSEQSLQTRAKQLKEQEKLVSTYSQQVDEKQAKLDELVLSNESIISELRQLLREKEHEIGNLQNSASAREKGTTEMTENMAAKLLISEEETFALHNELKQTKSIHHLELETLQGEIAELRGTEEQCQLKLKRQSDLDENDQQANSLQEEFNNLEQELKKKTEQLDSASKEEAQLLEALQKKDQAVYTLTVQISQHQDLVTSLSQQLKEKDASILHLTKSISREMVKAAEEKKQLADEVQTLEMQQRVSDENIKKLTEEVREFKKQTEQQEMLVHTKEAQRLELTTEQEQLHSQIGALTKARDLLKKKFQAALVTRRDLMKKVEELQREITGVAEKERKITELQETCKVLEDQVHKLSSDLTSGQKQIKELELHLERLKQQLMEKDSDLNALSESLSDKETFVDQLQQSVHEWEKEKEVLSAQLLQMAKERDSLIVKHHSELEEKEKTFEVERCQFHSNLEKLNMELTKKLEHSGGESSSKSETPTSAEDVNDGESEENDLLTVLKQEKELVQKKLQAALLARREVIKKAHEKDKLHREQLSQQKEEYNQISKLYSTQTKELESVKEQLSVHETKLTEFEYNQELIGLLQNQLSSVEVTLSDKENTLKQFRLQLEVQESKMLALLGQQDGIQSLENKLATMVSTLATKDMDLKRLEKDVDQFYRQINELQAELENAQIIIADKSEEAQMLKQSFSNLECQHQQEKDSQAAEISQLRSHCKSILTETENLKITLEQTTKEKENHHCSLVRLESQLLELHQDKDLFVAQLTALRKENATLTAALEQTAQSQEKVQDDTICAEDILTVKSELEKVQETVQERGSTITTLELALSEKEKLIEGLQLQIQKHSIFYEMEKERTQTNVLEVQQGAPDNPAETKSRELIQRKLQAALISRKEALKENQTLKYKINTLASEKEDFMSKVSILEKSLVDMKKEQELVQIEISSNHEEKKKLLSEVDRVFTENQNLIASCDSLKYTLETVSEEKQVFSHQLNLLKKTQAVETSEWKAKYDELKQEYESLLQAYENIGNEMDKMRQIVEATRKEKREVLFKLHELEAKTQDLEKQLEEATDQNENMKDKMRKFAKSKQQKVQELEDEIERLNEFQTRSAAKPSQTFQMSAQYNQLREENKLLQETYEELKIQLETTQNEKEQLLKEVNLSTSSREDLQAKNNIFQSELQSQINFTLQKNESLSSEMDSLWTKLAAKDEEVRVLEEERCLLSEKLERLELSCEEEGHEKNRTIARIQHELKSHQRDTVNLNEKVKILEDDKSLLQEELENVQEMSDKVKNEKEYLEAELLKNADRIDTLTEDLKTLRLRNNLLVNELDSFKEAKHNLIKEKEMQEVKLVKEFEEKLRSAQSGSTRSKSTTKELQELLKEKQQEINQLQKDCIRYQELLLDLERKIKASEFSSEEVQKKLELMTTEASKSDKEIKCLKDELINYKILLNDTRSEADRLRAQCSGLMDEVSEKDEKTKAQITEKEKELLMILDQQKTVHNKEIMDFQEKLDSLERDKDRVVGELLELQAELNGRDLHIKKLQVESNNNLAKLAAFAKSMSSLQDDRDRIIEETKQWENRFQETIQSKENQVQTKDEMLQKLNEEIKLKTFDIQELQRRVLKLEQTITEINLCSNDTEVKYQKEISNLNDIIREHSERLETTQKSLKEKEESLYKLSQENNNLRVQLSDTSDSVSKLEITQRTLEKELAEKQSESRQLQYENEGFCTELQKQSAISQQLKSMLSNKDAEISKLVSSKDGEMSEYLSEIQGQCRKQIEDYDRKLQILQDDKYNAYSECRKTETKVQELQIQFDKAREEKDQAIAKMDAFTKSMTSLQDDRDRIISNYRELEERHLSTQRQKDGIIQESVTENSKLKQELRNLLNRMDDLNSENAMLKAQLIKYREELNQVLSLKDNQLKELLEKQLQQIKKLESEKVSFEEQCREAQKSLEHQSENTKALQMENGQIVEQVEELRTILAQMKKDKSEINETQLVLELEQKLATKVLECNELQMDLNVKTTKLLELERKIIDAEQSAGKKLYELQAKSTVAMEMFQRTTETAENETNTAEVTVAELPEDFKMDQRLLDVLNQNQELTSQIRSLEKAIISLQNERDRLIDDLKQQQIKHELKSKGVTGLNDQTSWIGSDDSEISRYRNRVEELEKLLQLTKKTQEQTEQEIASYQNELAELRSEKNLLLTQSNAVKEQYLIALADREAQIAELKQLHQEARGSGAVRTLSNTYPIQRLEAVSLVGNENVAEQVKSLLVEKKQLQIEAQGYLQELHQKELQFQQCIEEKTVLSSQLKAVSQSLRDTQLRYGDLQNRYYRLERQYQTMRSSLQDEQQDEASEEVPPGAPQERASVIVEIDNLELSELQRRLLASEQRNNSAQQEMSQLSEMLADERLRRHGAEEALLKTEERLKTLDTAPSRAAPREYMIQLESDDEREALIIDPSEHVVVHKVKRGALSFKRWLRGRSFYCSKLMGSRARSRYLVFVYFATLHILVFMCLTGLL